VIMSHHDCSDHSINIMMSGGTISLHDSITVTMIYHGAEEMLCCLDISSAVYLWMLAANTAHTSDLMWSTNGSKHHHKPVVCLQQTQFYS
jgi:hypothetical protein